MTARQPDEPFIVNIFLVYSPMHYLASETIATNFERDARNFLFFLKQEFESLVDRAKWGASGFLPWPRFYPEKGLFGRLRRTRKNLEIVAKVCAGASEIRLHAPVIDTEAINYLINFLQASYPTARFSVRLIPDGLLNIQRHPLGRFKEAWQYFRKVRRIVCPALDYHTFCGDRTGSDAKIVDRIYVLPGLPHEYDPAKTVEISLVKGSESSGIDTAAGTARKRALVLGQPLTAYKRFSVKEMQSVASGIHAFIEACGIDEVEYKAHPRDPGKELSHPDYKELTIESPLETYLATTHFDLIIGVFSAALLTARLILPKSCRVVAYGTDVMRYRGDRERVNILSTFSRLEVELVMHRDVQLMPAAKHSLQ